MAYLYAYMMFTFSMNILLKWRSHALVLFCCSRYQKDSARRKTNAGKKLYYWRSSLFLVSVPVYAHKYWSACMVIAGENSLRGSCESTRSDHSTPGLLSKGKERLNSLYPLKLWSATFQNLTYWCFLSVSCQWPRAIFACELTISNLAGCAAGCCKLNPLSMMCT
jgi:hypothetical protein